MILTTLVFAVQDGMSRHLGAAYSVMTVVMIRFWFFAASSSARAPAPAACGGARGSERPRLQILRGVLLVDEICVTVLSFVLLGLIGSHAIFAIYPLLVAALAGPVLGEYVGWRRAVAIGVGLLGVLVILRPGFQVFSPVALVPLLGAFMFALYALLTRLVARDDSAETSFFYTGVAGAVAITLVAPFFWTPISGWADWGWMAALCVHGRVLGHFLLIKAYDVAEAGHRAALRLLPARLRRDPRLRALRRAARRLDHRRRGADPHRRALHHPAPGAARDRDGCGQQGQGPATCRGRGAGPRQRAVHHRPGRRQEAGDLAARLHGPGRRAA